MLFVSNSKMVLLCQPYQLLLLVKVSLEKCRHDSLVSGLELIHHYVFIEHRIWSLKYCRFSLKKWCAKPSVWRWIVWMGHTKHNSCLIQPYCRCCNVFLCHHSSHILPRRRTSCCHHQRKVCLGDTVGSSLQHHSDILNKLSRNTRTDKL